MHIGIRLQYYPTTTINYWYKYIYIYINTYTHRSTKTIICGYLIIYKHGVQINE